MEKLDIIKATPKSGNEKLTYLGKELEYSVFDFWKWSVSDLLSNATRGRLAEFIVGTALGLNPNEIRNEWDAYDLTSQSGVKIEVKSASYIQSWFQREYSKISFSIKPSLYWDENTNKQSNVSKRHADVYVFCLLKHKDQQTIDALKLEQWEFFVLPTYVLDSYERSQSSITLNSLKKLTSSISYDHLSQKIVEAYKKQINHISK